ncbi:MAG: OmpA family protein [Bdellovibrionales bacterium]|nr:OmpA family protein [Bdellovibrionales bacterium]
MVKVRLLSILLVLASANAHANVVGIDSQNFNPTSNGLDFVTVQSSETLEPGILNMGLFFNYAINTLPNYQNTTTQNRYSPQDELVSMDLSFGLGLMKDWDIGLTVPQVLMQNVDESSTVFRGQFQTLGVTEIRANTKYRFFGDANGGLATILSVNYFMIEDFPFTGRDPGPTFNLELAYDFTIGKVNLGTNIGYRFRNPGDRIDPTIPVEPSPDEFLFSFAGSYLISSIDTKVIAEIFSSLPTKQTQFSTDRELSSAEGLVGLKWDVSHSVALHVGGGTELYHGSASPDWRVYTGINWAVGPLFGKQYESYQPEALTAQNKPTVAFIDDVNFAQVPGAQETFIAKDVLFEFNSDKINESFKETLGKLATYLTKGDGFKTLQVVGHTDSVGSHAYNDDLSMRRAQSVVAYLKQIMPETEHAKLSADGRGEREPIADNGNFQGRALNRRVEFNIQR